MMLSYVTYYLIDRNTRKVIQKSYNDLLIRELFDAYRFVKAVYLLGVITNTMQPDPNFTPGPPSPLKIS